MTKKEQRKKIVTLPLISSKDSRLGVMMDHRGVDSEEFVLDRRQEGM